MPKFKCWICRLERTRGNYIKIKGGLRDGSIVKTCKSETCQKAARNWVSTLTNTK